MGRKKTTRVEIGIGEAFERARSEIEYLAEEMRDWFENMPENLQDGDKRSVIDETATALENARDSLEEIDIEKMPPISVVFFEYQQKRLSRAYRCSNAIGPLESIIEVCEDPDADEWKSYEMAINAEYLEEVSDALQNVVDELYSAEFPGMFG